MEIDDDEMLASFSEVISNGRQIDWDYWIQRMPALTPAEASRLMSGLDPDLFMDLDSSPGKNDTSKNRHRAHMIERLAHADQQSTSTPSDWLAWATRRDVAIHYEFERQVNLRKEEVEPVRMVADAPPGKSVLDATPRRQDLLAPLINRAVSECGSCNPPEVWAVLQAYAAAKQRPLFGITQEGIQWMGPNDDVKILSLKNLRARLNRLRKPAAKKRKNSPSREKARQDSPG